MCLAILVQYAGALILLVINHLTLLKDDVGNSIVLL